MPKSKRIRPLARFLSAGILSAAILPAVGSPAQTGIVFTDDTGYAIRGYDPVAYHADGQAVEGSEEFEAVWNGAKWLFASEEHREAFLADPERYAPQYGGYCAWAVSRGDLAPIDPEAWKIVDGKLYLNYSPRIQRKWEKDVARHIEEADRRWPELSSER